MGGSMGRTADGTRPRALPRNAGLHGFERALARQGFRRVAGVDEAGRGACAGPLVVAAAVLPPGGPIPGLADSKLLTPKAREAAYVSVQRRAVDAAVVVIPAAEVDRYGVHVANLAGMRRAVARLAEPADYVLTDGFAVRGMPAPALGVIKGDQVVSCIAAASVLAKVTRDRIMQEFDATWPEYGFAVHKGYCTEVHGRALDAHGPCAEHRRSFANVRAAMRGERGGWAAARALGDVVVLDVPGVGEDGGDASPVMERVAGSTRGTGER
ncbi:MAG TPA: ribonuclease HII [Frankiaceae bacterium]|jgi:ribonuclease HII